MPEELKCQNCGKGFIPTCHITRQKFCSDACRNRYHSAKGHYGVPVNICPECGDKVEQTEGPGRWRRFCSDRCRVKYDQRKVKERRMAKGRPKQICPNCGKEFQPEWKSGIPRKYCSDACRIEWWREYHKANPPEEEGAKECAMCGVPLTGKHRGGKYCSRFCYLLAVDRGHSEERCEWCGEKFLDYSGQGRRYCSRSCAVSARYTQQGMRRGKRRISADSVEEWKEKLTQAARANREGKRGKRVRLVCGATSMNTGLDGLIAIVRYHLKLDPYDGSVYVFRDGTGAAVQYIEWDGQGFRQSKRRAQSGRYPWPVGQAGEAVEISGEEFEYLLGKSIVPFKAKKGRDS